MFILLYSLYIYVHIIDIVGVASSLSLGAYFKASSIHFLCVGLNVLTKPYGQPLPTTGLMADRLLLHSAHTMDSTIFGEPVVEIPGAILLSGFLQFFLLGIVGMQAITYWADYKDDSWRKRIFIATVMTFCVYAICRVFISILTHGFQSADDVGGLQDLEDYNLSEALGTL
jgi:hypothetical protein